MLLLCLDYCSQLLFGYVYVWYIGPTLAASLEPLVDRRNVGILSLGSCSSVLPELVRLYGGPLFILIVT